MIKIKSIGAFYDADIRISCWNVQHDFATEKVEDIVKIIDTNNSKMYSFNIAEIVFKRD